MPEGALAAAIEAFRGYLDGDGEHPGLTPWDFEIGVEPPEGVDLAFDPKTKRLAVGFLALRRRVFFRWNGYGWELDEEQPPAVLDPPPGEEPSLAEVMAAIRRLEERLERLEAWLRQRLGGRR